METKISSFYEFTKAVDPTYQKLRKELEGIVGAELGAICRERKNVIKKYEEPWRACYEARAVVLRECMKKRGELSSEERDKYETPLYDVTQDPDLTYLSELEPHDFSSFKNKCEELRKKFQSFCTDVAEKIANIKAKKKARRSILQDIAQYVKSWKFDVDNIKKPYERSIENYAAELLGNAERSILPEYPWKKANVPGYGSSADIVDKAYDSYHNLSYKTRRYHSVIKINVDEIKSSADKIFAEVHIKKVQEEHKKACEELKKKKKKKQEEIKQSEEGTVNSVIQGAIETIGSQESTKSEDEAEVFTAEVKDGQKTQKEATKPQEDFANTVQAQSDENKSVDADTKLDDVLNKADRMASDVKQKKFSIASIAVSCCLGLAGVLFLPKIALFIGLAMASLSVPVAAICTGAVFLVASVLWFHHSKKNAAETKKDINNYLARKDVRKENRKKVVDRLNELGLKEDFKKDAPSVECADAIINVH